MADRVNFTGDDNSGFLVTENGRRLDRNDMGLPPSDQSLLMPAGAIAETFPRGGAGLGNVSPLVSGRIFLTAIGLRAGQRVTSISFLSSSTALDTPTNQWFCLTDSARAVLRFTSNDLTTPWATGALKTLSLTTPYDVTADGQFYLGIMVSATVAVNTIIGSTGSATGGGIAPKLSQASTTGQTTVPALPFSCLDGAVSTSYPWAYVS